MEKKIKKDNEEKWIELKKQERNYLKLNKPFKTSSIDVYEVIRTQNTNFNKIVVLIHGLGSNWDVWEKMFDAIYPECRLFSIDMPWSGQGIKNWGTVATPPEWLNCAFNSIPGKIDAVVAHSFGANTLLRYLELYDNKKPDAIVLISPPYKEFNEFTWNEINGTIDGLIPLLKEGFTASFTPKKRKKISEEIVTGMAEKIKERIGPLGWLQFINQLLLLSISDFKKISIPINLICGENETAASPRDTKKLKKKTNGKKMDIISGCGHFSMVEKPIIVGNLVNQFLDQYLK